MFLLNMLRGWVLPASWGSIGPTS